MRCDQELGDSYAVFGAFAFGQYRIALERWRSLDITVQDPLIGARLLRKMLSVWLRAGVIPELRRDELATMAVEAQALAESAGDEVELQRVRVAAHGLRWSKEMNDRPVTVDYIRSGQAEFLAIVDSFAARGNWEDFDVALDVFTARFQNIGAFNEALEIAHRRLRASNLPPHLQGDVIGMVAMTNFMMGDFKGVWTHYARHGKQAALTRPCSFPIHCMEHTLHCISGRGMNSTPSLPLKNGCGTSLGIY